MNKKKIKADNLPVWRDEFRADRPFPEKDRGLGDTVTRILWHLRIHQLVAWFFDKIGRSCWCLERQAWLNKRWPYRP
jgi:hypothetical protein